MKTLLLAGLLFASQIFVIAGEENPADYVVHEWGTFTSLQGGNGVQLGWRPSIGVDLPKFVYRYQNPKGNADGLLSVHALTKNVQAAKQRMETPVLYFYSDIEQIVDVTVDFPKGLHTEWYPRVSAMGPQMGGNIVSAGDDKKNISRSFIQWNDVRVIPKSSPDNEVGLEHMLKGNEASHYYAARETEANMIQMNGEADGGGTAEYDRFLFYRGLGYFDSPLNVTMNSRETELLIWNTGGEAIKQLYLLEVRNGRGSVQFLDEIKAGKRAKLKRDPKAALEPFDRFTKNVFDQIVSSLTAAGLYRAEALAMVNTWKDSWLGEDGVRVLYIMPEKWTDQILPLQLDPKPKEIKRVMVGRAEVILPSVEWQITRSIVLFGEPDSGLRENAVANIESLRLGRFLEPIIVKSVTSNPNRSYRLHANKLLHETKTRAMRKLSPNELFTYLSRGDGN